MSEFVVEWEYKNESVAEKTLKLSEVWNFYKARSERGRVKKGLQTEYKTESYTVTH